MVTRDSSSSNLTSPTTPKKVWKPKKAAVGDEGVPSMFAHATLSKPLKVNAAVTSTVIKKKKKATTTTTTTTSPTTKTTPVTAKAATSTSKSSPASKKKKSPATITTTTTQPKRKNTTSKAKAKTKSTPVSTATPVVTAAKAPSTTSIGDAAAAAAAATGAARTGGATTKQHPSHLRYSKTKPPRSGSHDSATSLVIGGCTTVAGTPTSWPRPHAVPADEKPALSHSQHQKTKKKSTTTAAASTAVASTPTNTPIRIADVTPEQEFHKDIDHLIPEMYRKKSAKQLEQEQQEEIQMMRRIMWELRRQEIEKEEQALQIQPIKPHVEATLRALQNAKKERDELDDHSSLDDSSTGSSKKLSAYSTHMRSKLAFFNSNHSAKLYTSDDESSDSDDSSSVSSWDSDASDGLFRG